MEMEQLSFPPHLETVKLGLFDRATSTDSPFIVDNSVVITNQTLPFFIMMKSEKPTMLKLQDKRILNFGVLKSNI